jgi:hypothetical protein
MSYKDEIIEFIDQLIRDWTLTKFLKER